MNNKKKLSLIVFAVISAILVFIDQITKIFAVNSLKDNKPYVIIKDIFEFYYLENTGTAWGMFDNGRIFFIILTVIIIVAVLCVLYKMPFEKKYYLLYLNCILVISGAVGNFIDRVYLGYVRDFIYFKLINFPVFNVADIYVTVSLFLFAVLILFVYEEDDFKFIKLSKH